MLKRYLIAVNVIKKACFSQLNGLKTAYIKELK